MLHFVLNLSHPSLFEQCSSPEVLPYHFLKLSNKGDKMDIYPKYNFMLEGGFSLPR